MLSDMQHGGSGRNNARTARECKGVCPKQGRGDPKTLVYIYISRNRTSNEIQQKPIHQCFVSFTQPLLPLTLFRQGSVVPPRTEPLEGENAWNGVDSALCRSVTRDDGLEAIYIYCSIYIYIFQPFLRYMLGKVLQIPWQPEYKRQIVAVTPFMQSNYLGSNTVTRNRKKYGIQMYKLLRKSTNLS